MCNASLLLCNCGIDQKTLPGSECAVSKLHVMVVRRRSNDEELLGIDQSGIAKKGVRTKPAPIVFI